MHEKDLQEQRRQQDLLFRVLSSDRFLNMEGLNNELPHFIYDYDPAWSTFVREMHDQLIKRLKTQGISVLSINLFDLCVDLLTQRNVWPRVLQAEEDMDKADFLTLLQNMLDPEKHMAPEIAQRVTEADPKPQIIFLTGVGEVFPYVRSHTVLNNLQSSLPRTPLVMFFPGRYEVTDSQGAALVLFGRLKDDSFYRAKRILDQEV